MDDRDGLPAAAKDFLTDEELRRWPTARDAGYRMAAEIRSARAENAALRAKLLAMAERVHAQSELLSRRAEKPTTTVDAAG